MGSTNSTPNYELSQFIGTDKPAWLQDYNGDMLKIDTGIAGAKTAADNAQSAADGAQGDATTALNSIADINTELGTVENTLSTATGNINTINSLIGNGEPTTTDKTIIGAINEVVAALRSDAVYLGISRISAIHDGTKTIDQLLTELTANLQTAVSALADSERFHPVAIGSGDGYEVGVKIDLGSILSNTKTISSMQIVGANFRTNASTGSLVAIECRFGSSIRLNHATIDTNGITVADLLSTVATFDVYVDLLKFGTKPV